MAGKTKKAVSTKKAVAIKKVGSKVKEDIYKSLGLLVFLFAMFWVGSKVFASSLYGGGSLLGGGGIYDGPSKVLPPNGGGIRIPNGLAGGTVSGYKFGDWNKNKIWETDKYEMGLPDYVIYADLNHNGLYTAGEPYTITDSTGAYHLNFTKNGTYTIREVKKEFTAQSLPGVLSGNQYVINVNGGISTANKNFGNYSTSHPGVPMTHVCHVTGDAEHPYEALYVDELWLNEHQDEEGNIYGITDLNWDEEIDVQDCLLYGN